MSKFAQYRAQPRGAVRAAGVTGTYEGGRGFSRTAESDLFLLAVSNFVGENTFYESAAQRDARFENLIHTVTQSNPTFIAGRDAKHVGLARFLRETMLMRSASLVLAAEYVAAGGPNGRTVVDAALQRPDEPAEFLAYWLTKHGRNLPMPVKRGLADAATRLYTQRAALKWDSTNRAVRMADVIELTHPRPRDSQQAHLYRYLLDVGHKRDNPRLSVDLDVLRTERMLRGMDETDRRAYARRFPHVLKQAGYTWERLSSWVPGGMDAEAWTAAIPMMGVMALMRNLRNFDEAKISETTIDYVISQLQSAEAVAAARVFPYKVWTAYKNAPSDNWRRALGRTLDLASQNVPDLDSTLLLIDTSGSMQTPLTSRSTVERYEVAAVMAAATMRRCTDVDLVIYGTDSMNITDAVRHVSSLQIVDFVHRHLGVVGHGTNGHTAIRKHFRPGLHKRVIIFTDDQQHDSGHVSVDIVPTIFTFDLAGYRAASLNTGQSGRYTLAGFTDALFTAIPVLEAGRDQRWPF